MTHAQAVVLAHTTLSEPIDSEAAVVPSLITQVPWSGRVLTGDALYCQATVCQAVVDAGGDYVVSVNANQPTLLRDIHWLFGEPHLLDDLRTARMVNKGQGRLEERVVRVTNDLAGYSRCPGLAQVFEVTRTRVDSGGRHHQAISYGVTSLPAYLADAARLLTLKRGHWTIENRVRCAHGPAVLAILRESVLNLVRQPGHGSGAAALRSYSRNPDRALAMVGCQVAEHAHALFCSV